MKFGVSQLCLVALTALTLLGAARAQRLEDGSVAFEARLRKTRDLRKQLFRGEIPADPKDKEHVEAIDCSARAVAFPLYWVGIGTFKPGKLSEIVEDFALRLKELDKYRPGSNTMLTLYTKEVIDRVVEVIQKCSDEKNKQIASINSCRVLWLISRRRFERGFLVSEKQWIDETLPRLTDGNGEHLANTCLTLLNDPKITDGHRYYLYRSLSALLALPAQTPPLVKPETVNKILRLAMKQVEKKVEFPKATPRHEVEGYKMLRQQAIAILAAARKISAGEKEKPALVLARVAGADTSLVPAPRLTERVEAAIGLARLGAEAAKTPDFQTDYAANMLALAIAEFGKEAASNIQAKSIERRRPWKIDAARIGEALDELKSVKNPYVQDVVKQCAAVVREIEAGRSPPTANGLLDWLSRNPAPSKSLFKSDPTSTVKSASLAAE